MKIPTIVVGVDGEPASHCALRFALDEAALRHARVIAIACWSSGENYLPWRSDGRGSDSRAKAEALIQQAVAAVATDSRERTMIVRETSDGKPGPTLVEASRKASFLVIGSTTRGGVARHAGKTVVDHCLRNSDVPVIVIPYAAPGIEDMDIETELHAAANLPARLDPIELIGDVA